jgi:hypothetical protein
MTSYSNCQYIIGSCLAHLSSRAYLNIYIPNCLLSLFSELSTATDNIPMASFCCSSTLRGIPCTNNIILIALDTTTLFTY